jgi:6-phosphofructokinase
MSKTFMTKNLCYAQSGGPTAVINESARAVIETSRQHPDKIGHVYAGLSGITGVLQEDLIDLNHESDADIAMLRNTPAAIFRSCRYKLKSLKEHPEQYKRLIEVFDAHNIGYFLYNGGGDSQDTAHKISQISSQMGYDLKCIGIPKTIDNDIPFTDASPGFASAAKYIATSIKETHLDLISMCSTSTKVFILEVMGRHAGWLAAASGLAAQQEDEGPHIILFPEVPFDEAPFLKRVKECVDTYGHCTVVVSEGIRGKSGKFLHDEGTHDMFGHAQLGGVAPLIAGIIKKAHGYKYHWAVADYMQRCARHIVSKTDLEHAYAVGKAAVDYALEGMNAVMPIICRDSSSPYQWHIEPFDLSKIANVEKKMPEEFISDDKMHITEKCREYLSPLIQGEDLPPFDNGLPQHAKLKLKLVEKKLVPCTHPA